MARVDFVSAKLLRANHRDIDRVSALVPSITIFVATYQSGSGSKTLTFTYTVQPGDNISDLQVTGLNLPNGATIADGAGNALTGSVAQDLALQIDTTPPTVQSVAALPNSGDENTGNTITLTVAMSEKVTVTGTPVLSLNDGGTAT
jgi:hypothetical protein